MNRFSENLKYAKRPEAALQRRRPSARFRLAAVDRASLRSGGDDEESARARAALGAAAYDQALLDGKHMTYGDAVRIATTVLGSPDLGR